MKIYLFNSKADKLKIIKCCIQNCLPNVNSISLCVLHYFLCSYGFFLGLWTKHFRI